MDERSRRKAAKYKRISDDREGRELGVMRQDEDLDELGERRDLEFVGDYEDNDISASTRSSKTRPRYNAMLAAAKAGEFEVIAAYTTGRITRRPREFEDLIELAERHGIEFQYVRSPEFDLKTAQGRRIARILAANDAGEAEDIAERVKRAAQQRAEKGLWHGGRVAPLGYRLVKKMVETKAGPKERVVGLQLDPDYAPLMRDAAKRLLRGESLYSICADWNHRGYTTREGARWISATLRRALLAPSAIGRREWGGKLYDTGWPELLDRRTWDRLHDLMDDPTRRYRPASGSYAGKHALGGGVTVCGNVVDGDICGKKLVSQTHRGKPRLICATAVTGGCGHVLITYEPLERFVLDMVLARLDTPEWRAALARRRDVPDGVEEALREELDDLDGRRRRVGDAVVSGAYTRAEAMDKVAEIEARQADLRRQLAALATGHVTDEIRTVADALKLWQNGDVMQRRRFVQAFVAEVRVRPLPKGWCTTLTRRRGESDEDLQCRRAEHERATLRERVEIVWHR